MEKIINKLINHMIKGVDTYTHNGSTWLIFTKSKQWVIELTESKTLWYNYNFFKGVFVYVSMDVVENQHYITKWVEDNVINKELTYVTLFRDARDRKQQFEDTLENGVKKIRKAHMKTDWSVEDTIENGVKETKSDDFNVSQFLCEEVIDKGVKETRLEMNITEGEVDDIIQDGVKHIFGDKWHKHHFVEDTIQNGVRDTQSNPYENKSWIEGVIKKGVRHTLNTEYMPTSMVEDIIQSGVKETNPLPDQSGELIGYGNYYHGKEDRTKAFYNYLEETIKFGVKET